MKGYEKVFSYILCCIFCDPLDPTTHPPRFTIPKFRNAALDHNEFKASQQFTERTWDTLNFSITEKEFFFPSENSFSFLKGNKNFWWKLCQFIFFGGDVRQFWGGMLDTFGRGMVFLGGMLDTFGRGIVNGALDSLEADGEWIMGK